MAHAELDCLAIDHHVGMGVTGASLMATRQLSHGPRPSHRVHYPELSRTAGSRSYRFTASLKPRIIERQPLSTLGTFVTQSRTFCRVCGRRSSGLARSILGRRARPWMADPIVSCSNRHVSACVPLGDVAVVTMKSRSREPPASSRALAVRRGRSSACRMGNSSRQFSSNWFQPEEPCRRAWPRTGQAGRSSSRGRRGSSASITTVPLDAVHVQGDIRCQVPRIDVAEARGMRVEVGQQLSCAKVQQWLRKARR